MEKPTSQILIETVVRATLKNLKEDPQRIIRNLVDLALRFSDGRVQKDLSPEVRAMLQNESSPYYALIRDVISYADTERLLRLGMDLGYNGCLCGSRKIRENEKKLNCGIPWTVLFQLGDRWTDHLPQYHSAISIGEELGICAWMLFASPAPGGEAELLRRHPDSAFFFFCQPEEVSSGLLDGILKVNNVMPVLRFKEGHEEAYSHLRSMGLPYAVYHPYGQDELKAILDGDLFAGAELARPVLTFLIPRPECPEAVRLQVCQAAQRVRNEPLYQTIPWELEWDNRRMQERVSQGVCSIRFDPEGRPVGWEGAPLPIPETLFEDGLVPVLKRVCPKARAE